MRRYFVTGTDTGVGKTTVTCCLAAGARTLGTVAAAKPIETGADELGGDAALLAEAAGHPPLRFAGFRAPVSPHRAAALEHRAVDLAGLEAWVAALRADTVLVEGIGGWRVPITDDYAVSDLARATGGQVIVVAADRLGVLNHTRMTVEAIERDGLPIAAIMLVRTGSSSDHDPSVQWNMDDLRALFRIPIIAVPRFAVGDMEKKIALGLALWADLT